MCAKDARKNESLRIGLTGGIASGKSTAIRHIRDRGFPVIDSDAIVHDLWEKDQEMIQDIRNVFGFDDDTDVRSRLRDMVFSDETARNRLNAIVHPKVFKAIEARLGDLKDRPVVFIDVPLLFESGYDRHVDMTVLVDIRPEIQKERLMTRDGIGAEEADRRIGAQMPMTEKRLLADVRITNNEDIQALHDAIDTFLDEVTG
jgi:dephospho-CoA kinase